MGKCFMVTNCCPEIWREPVRKCRSFAGFGCELAYKKCVAFLSTRAFPKLGLLINERICSFCRKLFSLKGRPQWRCRLFFFPKQDYSPWSVSNLIIRLKTQRSCKVYRRKKKCFINFKFCWQWMWYMYVRLIKTIFQIYSMFLCNCGTWIVLWLSRTFWILGGTVSYDIGITHLCDIMLA